MNAFQCFRFFKSRLCLCLWSFTCAAFLLAVQLMEAGTSGVNGHCAIVCVEGTALGSAALQHPDIEAKCVKGTARPLRTAQMGCVPRVSPPFLLLWVSSYHLWFYSWYESIYTLCNMVVKKYLLETKIQFYFSFFFTMHELYI